MRSISLQGRAAKGPQFAKVYVRMVNWDAAASEGPAYEHPTWKDPFVLVEMDLDGSVEDLTILSICKWGRGVIPYAWLFLANSGGRMLSWTEGDAANPTEQCTTTESAASDQLQPLDPNRLVCSIPRFELPMTFVLLSRPSSFVPKTTVCDVLEKLQSIVIREKEAPLLEAKAKREHRRQLDEQRKLRIAELEDAQRRRDVKAILQSHQKEDQRLVHRRSPGGAEGCAA